MKGYVSAGDEVHKMALRTGFSTEALSELKYAAEICGTDLGSLEKGVKKMSKTIVDASDGLTTYVRAFDRIGLSAQELIDLSPEEQFDKIAMAIAKVESPTIRAAVAQEIFGRAGTQLLPLFAQGAEGIEELRQKAHDMGLVFDQEAAEKAARLNDSMTTLKGSFKGATMVIAEALVPTITSLVDKVSSIITRYKDWAKEHPGLSDLIVKLTAGVGILLTVLGPILILLPALAAGFAVLTGPIGLVAAAVIGLIALGTLVYVKWEPISSFFAEIWEKIVGIFTGAYTAIKEALTGFIENYINSFSESFETIKELTSGGWKIISGFFSNAFTTIKDALTGFIEDFITFFTDFSTKLKEIVTGMVTAIIKKFTGLFTKVKEITTKLKDSTIGIFSKLKKKVVGGSIVPLMCQEIEKTIRLSKEKSIKEFEALAEGGKLALGTLADASEKSMGNISDYVTDMQISSSAAFEGIEKSLRSSAKSILKTLEKEAIGHIIKWVVKVIPFPASLVATAVAIAGVKALFSKIKLAEGGIVTRPTHALVGERGPEAVIPLDKFKSFGGLMPAPIIIKQTNYFYGDIHGISDVDEISNRLAERTRRAIERGRK